MSVKSKRVPLNEVSYTAKCGTEINPGDYVLASVTGAGHGSIHVGVYRGQYPDGKIALDVQTHTSVLVHKDTREEYDYKLEDKELPYPSYYDEKGVYRGYSAAEWDVWNIAREVRKTDFEYEKRPYSRRHALQNNKVYSLATIAELKRL